MLDLQFKKALIIEDDAAFSSALSRWVLELGYEGTTVSSARGAVETLNDCAEWALILLDLGLPDIPGHALLHQLHTHGVETPVIVMSGTEDVRDVVRAWRASAADFLRKPFGIEELETAISRATRPRPQRARSSAVIHATKALPPRSSALTRATHRAVDDPPASAGRPPTLSGRSTRSGSTPSVAGTASGASSASSGAGSASRAGPSTAAGPASAAGSAARAGPSSAAGSAARAGSTSAAGPASTAGSATAAGSGNAIGTDERALLDLLTAELKKGTIEIPVMDPSVANLQRFLTRSDYGMPEVADAVSRDGALVTGVLRIANSAQFARGTQVTSLADACSRLGANRVVGIALEVAVRNQFTLPDEPYRGIMSAVWRNASASAWLAGELGRALGRHDADDLYLAALLHNLGEVVCIKLLAELEQTGISLPPHDVLWNTVGGIHERIGRSVASRWNLPPTIVKLIGHHHRPARTPENVEDRNIRMVVTGAWAFAVENGFSYFPQHDGAESRRYFTTLGVKPAAVDDLATALASWRS